MGLPPGPRYVLRLLPFVAGPSLVTYLTLSLATVNGWLALPQWVLYLFVMLAPTILFLSTIQYGKCVNNCKAVSLGAIRPPVVKEWTLLSIRKHVDEVRNGYPGDVTLRYAEKYGNTYRIQLLNKCDVITSEPEHVKAILATQFDSFDKGPVFIEQMSSLLGSGVFNSDGDMWKFHRSMTRPFFTRERISDFDIYNCHCDLALNTIRKRIREGFPLDFQDLVSRFTLDSTAEFLFGFSISSLAAGLPDPPLYESLTPRSFYEHPSTSFIKNFIQGQQQSVYRLQFDSNWPLVEFWKDKIRPARQALDEFITPFLNQALKSQMKGDESHVAESKREDNTLLAHLVKHTQDPKILRDELINLLVAGRDTTGSLLTYSLYMLIQNPHIEVRLRDEIFEKVGRTGNPTYERMREMKFMRAFLNEVLRLYPPVPVDSRCPNKDVVLPAAKSGQDPVFIPAGTPTEYDVINMQRRVDLWGPDSLLFDPDRFLDHRLHKYLLSNPYIFSPFNAGPRICLGQQFAYHEATFFIVRLMQHFTSFSLASAVNTPPPSDWAVGTGRKATETVYVSTHLTLHVKNGLWVQMEELNGTHSESMS